MKRTPMMFLMTLALVAALVVSGCGNDEAAMNDQPQATNSTTPAPAPAPADTSSDEMTTTPPPADSGRTVMAASDGSKSEALRIVKTAPQSVRVGRAFQYQIVVTNQSNAPLENVQLKEKVASGLKVAGSSPQAKISGDTLIWDLGTLDAGASKSITVEATASAAGQSQNCATATWSGMADNCLSIVAVQPVLQLAKTAPAEVLLCDEIPVKVTVSNTGTGTAEGVTVTDDLPDGLTTADGKSKVEWNVGSLAAGQSRELTTNLKASKTGSFTNTAMAASTGGLKAQASSKTTVRQPVLTVSKSAPGMRYIGTPVKYDIVVSNKGDAEARQTTLTDVLPSGANFVSATDGGQLSGGKVVWSLGTLAPNASKSVSVTLTSGQIGQIENTATASAYCASGSDSAKVSIEGIAAILLECVDEADPIEIGSNETYSIKVTNQGSAMDTNIVIEATLPAEQDYVSSDGPTKAAISGKVVKFAPLASLAPKASVVYKVVAKGVKTGDVRFKVSLTSDVTRTPVEETESTHIYE